VRSATLGSELMFHNIHYAYCCLGQRSFPIARLQTVPIGVAKQAYNCYVLPGHGIFGIWNKDLWHAFGLATVRGRPFGVRVFWEIAADAPVSASGGNRAKSMVVTIYGGDEQAHHEQR
jgi:hypothetical protein